VEEPVPGKLVVADKMLAAVPEVAVAERQGNQDRIVVRKSLAALPGLLAARWGEIYDPLGFLSDVLFTGIFSVYCKFS